MSRREQGAGEEGPFGRGKIGLEHGKRGFQVPEQGVLPAEMLLRQLLPLGQAKIEQGVPAPAMLGGEIQIAIGECDQRAIGDGARAAAVRAGGLSLPPQNGVEQAETAGVDGEDQAVRSGNTV